MSVADIPFEWATRFGLALTPLFDAHEAPRDESHYVLLDGGYGSFALSISDEPLWKSHLPADWSWSSNIPHHVTVTDREIAIVRWDKPKPELLIRSSVENQLEAFYGYLTADRVQSTQRVIDHMVTIFRRIRSLVAEALLEDRYSVDVYLAFLADLISRSHRETARVYDGAPLEGSDLLRKLPKYGLSTLYDDVTARAHSSVPVSLLPELAVRHAGSEIFQEAHFELLRAPSADLFGYVGPAESRPRTRGGAHFTPPALARTIVEQTLAQLSNLERRERLVVVDPACGSGAFLHEAVRTLRRSGFSGKLVLVGRDISVAAVAMARFVLNHAATDWSPVGGLEIDLRVGDSLSDEPLPAADLILMNPPFIAWAAMSKAQRQQMATILGDKLAGRGDFSMAFVTRALEVLAPGGALGALLPGSLLTLHAAEAWRNDLLDRAELRFVASLGDYGLFAYAQVQVAATVFSKPKAGEPPQNHVDALVTGNNAEATGNALRMLRRDRAKGRFIEDREWRLFRTSIEHLRSRPTWRLIPPRTEAALKRLAESGCVVPLGELFDVRQGVRTGANPVFLLSESQLKQLPSKERNWFKPALMNESISNGLIEINHWVFYPYDQHGLAITNEAGLERHVPTYLRNVLRSEQSALKVRANILRGGREDWWGLSERRAWALDTTPRIVSKYFGGPGGFATDLDGRYIVVQGFAWFMKGGGNELLDVEAEHGLTLSDFLSAYMALMNSGMFARLLEIFSPHVAGGQFDLSPRYVNSIPVPNLEVLAAESRRGRLVSRLSALGRSPRLTEPDWQVNVDRLTIELYGEDISLQG